MKKYAKIVQVDKRGQVVIPKEVRDALGVDEGVGFWVYSIGDEGIFLKKIEKEELSSDDPLLQELKEKADKINLSKEKLDTAMDEYSEEKEVEEI